MFKSLIFVDFSWKMLSIPVHDLATVMIEKAKALYSSDESSIPSFNFMSQSEIVEFHQQLDKIT
jgi:hypothetical protein